jgi:hypothetical protein
MQDAVLNLLSGACLLCAAYRSAKVLRNRAAVEHRSVLDPLEDPAPPSRGASENTTPVTRRASRRITLTPQQAAPLIADTDRRAVSWLQFWVLLGLLQFSATYKVWYAVEARTLLSMLAALPLDSFSSAVGSVFEHLAEPVVGNFGQRAVRFLLLRVRAAAAAASPVLCALSAAMVSPRVLAAAPAAGERGSVAEDLVLVPLFLCTPCPAPLAAPQTSLHGGQLWMRRRKRWPLSGVGGT